MNDIFSLLNEQVSRRVLYVNVTATLGVDVPPNASADDIKTALEVTNLSADDPIAMLAQNPDKFFGRTTKVISNTRLASLESIRTLDIGDIEHWTCLSECAKTLYVQCQEQGCSSRYVPKGADKRAIVPKGHS